MIITFWKPEVQGRTIATIKKTLTPKLFLVPLNLLRVAPKSPDFTFWTKYYTILDILMSWDRNNNNKKDNF